MRLHVAGLPASPSTKVKLDLVKQRKKLLKEVDEFNNDALLLLADAIVIDEEDTADTHVDDRVYLDLLDKGEEFPAPAPAAPATVEKGKLPAEMKRLILPSSLGLQACEDADLLELVKKELQLLQGQANDCLQGVRSALGEKAFVYRHNLRTADSKVKKTRSWKKLMTVNKRLNLHRWVYSKARQSMIDLGASPALLSIYQPLEREDLRVSTAVWEPNAPGQRDIPLAWFWNMDLGPRDEGDNLLRECKHSFLPNFPPPHTWAVYRVHYLRADARHKRWKEELTLLGYEMVWTRRYFQHRAATWRANVRGPRAKTLGHRAFAYRQVAYWEKLANVSWNVFQSVHRGLDQVFGSQPLTQSPPL